MLILSMFFWGLGWPSAKVLTHYSSAVNFAVYRYIVVFATILLTLLVLRVKIKIKKEGIPFVLYSGTLLALYSYFFFMGLRNGAAGAGGVLVTTLNPIIAYTLGMALDRKWPTRKEGLGLVLGLIAGLVLLKVWSNTAAVLDGGNLYFLLAAFTWAIMSKFTSRGASYGSSLSFSLWQYLITLICLLPLANFQEFGAALQIKDMAFWGNLIFSSVFVTSLATTVYFLATTRLGAEKASSYIFMVPLAAALSAWFFVGERILPHTIAGGILGIVAVYVINSKKSVK